MTTDAKSAVALSSLPPEEQARIHLTAIWPSLTPRESYELRCLDARTKPARKGPRNFFDSVDAVVEAAMNLRDSWDVFVGVGTRACPEALTMTLCQHEERGFTHVSRLKAIWGDFDAKAPGELQERADLLQSLALPPDLLVGSGTGFHAYWLLTEPTSELIRVEVVNRGLRVHFGADNAMDAARILRVAGTFNYKYGEPLPVRLLRSPNV